MSQPFVGEIRLVGFNFAPQGWAMCNGAIMSIAQNSTLFTLIGTTYGGDGVNTFGLPDLRGRAPVHMGNGLVQGQLGGAETVTLTTGQIPTHQHSWATAAVADTEKFSDGYLATLAAGSLPAYDPSLTSPVALDPSTIGNSGGGLPHENMAPFVTINFVISLFGIFPSRN